MATCDAADLQHFRSISWCADLLDDPAFIITQTISRQDKSSTEDALFAETLKTEDTISACLSMYKRPTTGVARIDEVRTLLTLGYRLNGYPHVCHGGIVSTIMDEVMGMLLSVNKDLEGAIVREATVTASLNITFIKPVKTPGTVLVTAKFKDITGRKYFIESSVRDANGVVLAKAEALWIGLNGSK